MYDLVAIVSLDYDLDYLPHFLRHYKDVDRMGFILHANEDCHPVINHTKELIRDAKRAVKFDVWIGKFSDAEKCRRQEALRDKDKWTLYPDIDEFYDFGDHPDSLAEYKYIQHPDGSSCLLYGQLLDWMYDRTRRPVELKPTPSIYEQYTYPCAMRCTSPGIENKVCAIKGKFKYRNPHMGFMLPEAYRSSGGEFVNIHHYRWTTQRIPKLAHRMEWSVGRLGAETRDELEYYRSNI